MTTWDRCAAWWGKLSSRPEHRRDHRGSTQHHWGKERMAHPCPRSVRPPFRAPVGVLFSRNLQTHPLPFPFAQIIEQVQQRLFVAHAKEYYRERKAGNVAFATPKNMLAFGYRLVRPLSSALSLGGVRLAAFSHRLTPLLSILEHGANAGFATDEEPARARFRRGVPQYDRCDARLVPRLGPARQSVS